MFVGGKSGLSLVKAIFTDYKVLQPALRFCTFATLFMSLKLLFLRPQKNTTIMTELEAIKARHSVRQYLDKPIEAEKIEAIQACIDRCNREGGVHIQLIANEPKAFASLMAKYGKFQNVSNYVALVAPKGKPGSGLGLYLADSFMKKMDGDLILHNGDKGFTADIFVRKV